MAEHIIASFDPGSLSGVWPVGSANSHAGVAMNFLGESTKITKCSFKLQKHGSPSGTLTAKLYAMTGSYGSTGKPTGSVLATSDGVGAGTLVDGDFQTFTFTGGEQYTMTGATYYEIAIAYSTTSSTHYVEIIYSNGGYTGNGAELTLPSTWAETAEDFQFYVYGLDVAPTVTTQAVSSVTNNSCTGNGNITVTGGDATAVTRRGFCYKTGTTGDPTTADSVAYDNGAFGTGAYTKSITGLTVNTDYRVRAYAVNSAGTSYGDTVQLNLATTTVLSIPTAYINLQSPVETVTTKSRSYMRLKELRIK